MKFFQSVGAKLFIIVFLSIFISVLVVGLISFSQAQSIIEEKIENASTQTVIAASEKIELMLKQFGDMSLQFSTNKDLQDALFMIFKEGAEPAKKFAAKATFQNALVQVAQSNPSIVAITMLDTVNGTESISTESTSVAMVDPATEWYQKAIELKGTPLWLPAKENGYSGTAAGNLFALTRLLGKYLIVLEIDSALLTDTLQSIQITPSSRAIIYNDQNEILISPLSEEIGTTISIVDLQQDNLVVGDPIQLTDWHLAGIAPTDELLQDTVVIKRLTFIMSAVGVVLALAIGYLIIQFIAKPLLRISRLLSEGASGNLHVRANMSRKDEIGQVARSFDEMMEQTTRLIEQTNHSASKVLGTSKSLLEVARLTSETAKGISTATAETASGSTMLAKESESGFLIVNQITEHLGDVVRSADEISESSLEVQHASNEGKLQMDSLVSITAETETTMNELVNKVGKLEERSASIQKILELLNGITKNSRTLSFNAGIEASRSGQATNGFKVIALEMKNLSDQTNDSIRIVNEITSEIQLEIRETVALLTDSLPLLHKQSQSVKDANDIFTKVYNRTEVFTQQIEHINRYVSVLEAQQRELYQSMMNVSGFSQESSATSEQVAALSVDQYKSSEEVVNIAQELAALSHQLQESLQRYSVEDQSA